MHHETRPRPRPHCRVNANIGYREYNKSTVTKLEALDQLKCFTATLDNKHLYTINVDIRTTQ